MKKEVIFMLSEFLWWRIALVLQIWDEIDRTILLTSRAAACKGTLNPARVQYELRISSGLNLFWYGSME